MFSWLVNIQSPPPPPPTNTAPPFTPSPNTAAHFHMSVMDKIDYLILSNEVMPQSPLHSSDALLNPPFQVRNHVNNLNKMNRAMLTWQEVAYLIKNPKDRQPMNNELKWLYVWSRAITKNQRVEVFGGSRLIIYKLQQNRFIFIKLIIRTTFKIWIPIWQTF